jgi:RND family efflux transporter MFP subunit
MEQSLRIRRIAASAAAVALPLAALLLSGCSTEHKARPVPQVVVVSKPVAQEVTDVDTYTGRFEAIDTVDIRARVGGYLQTIAFKDGALVKKGDLLFVIDPRPYQAAVAECEGALAKARSQLKLSEQEFERASVLIKTNTIAGSLYDQRQQAVQSAQADVATANAALTRARLDLSFTRIAAPMSGKISRKLVSEGNLVNGGAGDATILTTIVSLDALDIYFDVDEESYLRHMRAATRSGGDQPVAVSLAGDQQPSLSGKMNFVDNRLDSSTGTLRQRARVPNPDLLLSPGQFGRVHLSNNAPHAALLVPDAAVATDATRRVLYVVKEDKTVAVVPVTPGRLFGNMREISAGLKAGDTVIVEGGQRVRAGDTVSPQLRGAAPKLALNAAPEATQ